MKNIRRYFGQAIFSLIKNVLDDYLFNPLVHIYLLPGGIMPKRHSLLAVGYDVHIRALVHPIDKDPDNPDFRTTLFDFKSRPEDPEVARRVHEVDRVDGPGRELIYRMERGNDVVAGIGFATAMEYRRFFWIAPRSGLATRWGITVTNAPGTVDPDYRGEAGVLVYNRDREHFDLRYGMRISQVIFCWALTPDFREVFDHAELPPTERGGEGFGSTGIFHKLQ